MNIVGKPQQICNEQLYFLHNHKNKGLETDSPQRGTTDNRNAYEHAKYAKLTTTIW
jgi:hypothetical protein